jgi:DNA-nicking Smr family endonuclease
MLRPMGKRHSGQDTDSELWQRVVESAKPLAKGKAMRSDHRPKEKAREPAKEAAQESPRPAPKAAARPAPAARAEVLNRQTARQLERGRLAVDARLDLHGMRQGDAHAALRRFLKSAQRKGHRHLLVITGKGADLDENGPFYAQEERGVLRQAVPHWLGQPDLAGVVISYAEAPRRLGGEGALYVRLRAAKRV